MMDEHIEFSVAEHSVFYRGTPFMGRQEVAESIFRRLGTEWEDFIVKPHDAGDVIVMQGRYGGKYKATGRSTDAQVVHVWTIRNGKLSKFQQYVHDGTMRSTHVAACAPLGFMLAGLGPGFQTALEVWT